MMSNPVSQGMLARKDKFTAISAQLYSKNPLSSAVSLITHLSFISIADQEAQLSLFLSLLLVSDMAEPLTTVVVSMQRDHLQGISDFSNAG